MASRRIVTVFGGTGFIGQQIVQRLARLDYVVRVAVRDTEAARSLITQGRVGQIVPLAVDIGEPGAVARAIAGVDAVVNCVGILSERRPDDFMRVHGSAPRHMAIAATQAGARHFVHISAIGAAVDSSSSYARSKAEGEKEVSCAFPSATILRPSIVFGPGDHFFNRFAGMSRLLPFMPVVGGNTRFQPVFVGDVADAVLMSLERQVAYGRIFELGGPRIATFRELLSYMLDVINRRRVIIEIPKGIANLQASIYERFPNPPLTRDQILLLAHDNVVSLGSLDMNVLGISPTSLEAVVPNYLQRYRVGGERRLTRVD